jgi:hypothetical protein
MLVHAQTQTGGAEKWLVFVPVVLWGIAVAAWLITRRQRTLGFFLAAVVFGGLGLFMGGYGLIEIRRAQEGLPHGEGCLACIQGVLVVLAGLLLLLIGALIGFVALFLGLPSRVDSAPGSIGRLIGGQPSSEDSVDSSGNGDQESDV